MDALLYDILARLNNDLQPDDDPRAANARHRLVDLLTIAILGGPCSQGVATASAGHSPRLRCHRSHVRSNSSRVSCFNSPRPWVTTSCMGIAGGQIARHHMGLPAPQFHVEHAQHPHFDHGRSHPWRSR